MNMTKKVKKLAQQEIDSYPPTQQRHYAVWRYMNRHHCSIAVAYENVYHVSTESARASASRLSKSPAWLDLVDRMDEASNRQPDDVKTEIAAALLSILRNEKSYPADKVKAASVLASIYGISEQKVSVTVDAVSQYAEKCLRQAEAEPLVDPQNALPLPNQEDTIDV